MAIETLRPSGAGFSTTWTSQFPVAGAHWDKVDEAVSDDDTTYIRTNPTGSPTAKLDLYDIPDTAIPADAIIDSITVFTRVRSEDDTFRGQHFEAVRTGGTTYFGAVHALDPTTVPYPLYSNVWAVNPNTLAAWQRAEIAALQIGVRGYSGYDLDLLTDYPIRCTQVYMEIAYHVGAVSGVEVIMDGFVLVA